MWWRDWSEGVVVPRAHAAYGSRNESILHRGDGERPLRLAVHNAALPATEELRFLLELGRLGEVELTVTAPHRGLRHITIDWATIDTDSADVQLVEPNGTRTWIAAPGLEHISYLAHGIFARFGEPEQVVRERYAYANATRWYNDVFVSPTPRIGFPDSDPFAVTVNEALALVGLKLRTTGNERISASDIGGTLVGFGTQRWKVVRTLLPAGWRWWGALVQAGTAGATELVRTGEGLHSRVDRALVARDKVLRHSMLPPVHTHQDALLYHLDAMTLWLGGAFDVLARVAHETFGFTSSPRGAAWQRQGWRTKLDAADPALHALTEPGTPLRAVIDLVFEIRNTIHGAPLHGVHAHGGASRDVNLFEQPDDPTGIVEAAFALLGGPERWGRRSPAIPGTIGSLWDPVPFTQLLFTHALAALDVLMANTPVDRLPNVDPTKLNDTWATDRTWTPWLIDRCRLLHGFTRLFPNEPLT